MRALLIADDPEEREFLSYLLRTGGMTVARTAVPRLADKNVPAHTTDLILLCAAPQELFALVNRLRALSNVPLVVIADPLPEAEQCTLLDAGADLLLARPYAPRVLLRYLRRQLLRAGSLPPSTLTPIEMQSIQLDPDTRRVTVSGRDPQDLTKLEFGLLYVLMIHPEQVIPVEMIIERVWGYSGEGSRELVRGLIRRLRRKIEPDPQHPQFIHNHPGVGYRFTAPGG